MSTANEKAASIWKSCEFPSKSFTSEYSCYFYGYLLWGGPYRFPGFVSAYSRSNMKPKSILKRARKWIEELFCRFSGASATLHVPFILCSFNLIYMFFPFMFIPMCIDVYWCPFIFLSFACIFLSCCIHILSFPFQSYGNGSMAWPGDRVQQMVIAKLSLSLSLNNPSTYDIVQRCSKDICHKNNTERERAREKESERVGCQMRW